MSGCAEYCLRVVGLLWAVLGVPGAPSGRVWPVGSGGVASRGCIHTSKIVSQKVHPSRRLTLRMVSALLKNVKEITARSRDSNA